MGASKKVIGRSGTLSLRKITLRCRFETPLVLVYSYAAKAVNLQASLRSYAASAAACIAFQRTLAILARSLSTAMSVGRLGEIAASSVPNSNAPVSGSWVGSRYFLHLAEPQPALFSVMHRPISPRNSPWSVIAAKSSGRSIFAVREGLPDASRGARPTLSPRANM